MFDADRLRRIVPWVLRIGWVAVLLLGGTAIDGALADTAGGPADATRWLCLAGWIVGVAAMAVPAATTLTATRLVVPLAVPVAVLAWSAGADAVDGAAFLGAAIITSVVAGSSALGRGFVQASAYGDEDRHLLRPPVAYLAVATLAWVIWAVATLLTGVMAANGETVWALVFGGVTLAGGVLLFPRWHRLTRRWIVLVPVGVVIHDHVVLAETLMLRRQEIARMGLALAGTDAADFTGPTSGHAVEIRTNESITALVSLVPGAPSGSAIHLTGCLIAPTRPGQVLAAATERRFPVGAIG
ncbi:MAG: hypothetical protein RIB65_00135 [Ilumatobacter fluminis]|uniref:hypothetical protein n=1 Tax=Ilumatobacter fluminis TaxID=467091 RepID=UPI0032EB8969